MKDDVPTVVGLLADYGPKLKAECETSNAAPQSGVEADPLSHAGSEAFVAALRAAMADEAARPPASPSTGGDSALVVINGVITVARASGRSPVELFFAAQTDTNSAGNACAVTGALTHPTHAVPATSAGGLEAACRSIASTSSKH